MKFRVTERFETHSKLRNETLVVLRRDSWDDFGFKTLFDVEMIPAGGEPIELGSVKILMAGQKDGRTPFDESRFDALDGRYCSLGQDIDYYEKLAEIPEAERTTFLSAIRDAATNPSIASAFEKEEGWNTSLVRFGQAEYTLAAAQSLFGGEASPTESTWFRHKSTELDLTMQFDFDDIGPLPGRCKIIIGYNGVGKTRLLAEMARDISKVGLARQSQRQKRERTFSSVVAVSYSAFDSFEIPPVSLGGRDALFDGEDTSTTTRFGYTYCGLRRLQNGRASSELKSVDELDREVTEAFRTAHRRDPDALRGALAELEEDPSFGRAGLRLSDWVRDERPPHDILGLLSAGQKIVINIVVQLGAHLRTQSLVLVDEPETHLHPPLLAALLRAIQRLLEAFDSHAVIATHSPVVLQEVPAKDVQVLERFGSAVRAVEPRLETFGAGLGELTHEAFGLDNTVSDYRATIRLLASEMGVDAFDQLFPMGLSAQARALAARAQRQSD